MRHVITIRISLFVFTMYLLFVQPVNGIKTARLIENTISAEQGDVVSRKWYWEGYFVE